MNPDMGRMWGGGRHSGGGSGSFGGGRDSGLPFYPLGNNTCSPPDPCGGNGPGGCVAGKVGNLPQAGPQTGSCPGSTGVRSIPPCPINNIDNQVIDSVPVDQM